MAGKRFFLFSPLNHRLNEIIPLTQALSQRSRAKNFPLNLISQFLMKNLFISFSISAMRRRNKNLKKLEKQYKNTERKEKFTFEYKLAKLKSIFFLPLGAASVLGTDEVSRNINASLAPHKENFPLIARLLFTLFAPAQGARVVEKLKNIGR